ncbi:MAG: hypothetical protein U0165_08640 [Polyangiaceae bacterium]
MSSPVPVPLDRVVIPLPQAKAGTEIVLKGSVYSTFDGSTIDAATTSWPDGAPGGASVQAGGLVDTGEATGLHLVSRDISNHEVHLVTTGNPAPACEALGVHGPCLVLRQRELAMARLQSTADWTRTLRGSLTMDVQVAAVPVLPVPPDPVLPYLRALSLTLLIAVMISIVIQVRRLRARSPRGQLIALAERVREGIRKADPVLAAPLKPVIESAWRAVRSGRVDASSSEGQRISKLLLQVESRLGSLQQRIRTDAEREVVESLSSEFDAALDAAEEAHGSLSAQSL